MKIIFTTLVLLFSVVSINVYAASEDYICPMHPHIHGKEGDTCPICGMDLVLFETEDDTANKMETSSHAQHAITLSEGMIQTIGVKTAKVTKEDFGGTIRAFANIVRNERTERKVTSRAEGWINELGASAVGDFVKKGDLLYKIHSPDIVIAQKDYILDLKAGRVANNLSAYRVFNHYEVNEQVIKEIEKNKEPVQAIPYFADADGTITEINVRKGGYVTLNSVIAIINDFSTLWAQVHVAEKDLPFIAQNTPAVITIPTDNNHTIKTKVDYIYPTIDPETRTALVRLVVDNKDGKLRPGGYADVEFTTAQDLRLTVPTEAILKASDGDRVIIALGEGKFAPIHVKTGISSKGKTEIIEGLSVGDEVVTSSQFLIDSESSLREALRKYSSESSHTGGGHAGH